jgi:cytochrome c
MVRRTLCSRRLTCNGGLTPCRYVTGKQHRMDSLEVNKGVAAVLVAGIAFFLSGYIGTLLVDNKEPAKVAFEIAMPQPAGAAAPAPAGPDNIDGLIATADPAKGEAFTKTICVACHTFTQGGPAGVGPNLYNVVGGPHAHMQGFNYTAGMKAKTGPWTFAELNEWLYKPSAYVPGTRMIFPGIPNAQTRANVIDYLRTLSPDPLPLPTTEAQAETEAKPGEPPAK